MAWLRRSLSLLSKKKRREDFEANRRALTELAEEQRQKARTFREAYEHSGQKDWLELARETEEDARETERQKRRKERLDHFREGMGFGSENGNN